MALVKRHRSQTILYTTFNLKASFDFNMKSIGICSYLKNPKQKPKLFTKPRNQYAYPLQLPLYCILPHHITPKKTANPGIRI